MDTVKSPGQIAYEAFHAPSAPPRAWDQLTPLGRDRWDFVARAVVEQWAKRVDWQSD